MKLLGLSLMARDFDRQVGEVQVSISVRNGYTAFGILVTQAVGEARLGKEEVRPSIDLPYRAC